MSPSLAGMVAGVLSAVALLTLLAAAGTTGVPQIERHRRLVAGLLSHRRTLAAVVVALVILVATRIVVLGVAAAAVLWLAPTMIATSRQRRREQAMLEAVHLWLLQLRTVLAAGSGLEQALAEVATLQPPHSPLASASHRMVARMERLGPIRALRGFANDVDNHVADAAVAVLVNALSRQNVGVATALDDLIAWGEQDVRQQRDIDARLQSVRTERWMVIAIFAALACYFTLANPELMAVYTTSLGQVVLAAILGVAALCLWSLDRMARPQRPSRFFIREEAG
ncbi:type II secretion system F family protein [Nitriliruptor alkaliphilus]|uniref:type II secretion system F family protein n=1 Tax=Nitriliruptor alkaliphilus TaxID=427918 RepID=UPI0009F91BC5|nr:type II secretion system F family protein [Nitriliruptor alkaliphilus]